MNDDEFERELTAGLRRMTSANLPLEVRERLEATLRTSASTSRPRSILMPATLAALAIATAVILTGTRMSPSGVTHDVGAKSPDGMAASEHAPTSFGRS